ncbi:uncharacterized protein LOC103309291, partial [Acyrthosiphon pisum]|uniref:Zinc finger BED domain-containing protein 4 n=1 Tax=Acyrthosiphon pisum TaxID=7029 RepID=A0A8R2JVF7_ACYPI
AITSKVRCVAHTLNLAIEEGLKIQSIRGVFARARMVVKKLRTPIYAGLLKQENKKQAIRDVETRWSSVYDMLYRLLELKDFCLKFQETMNDLKLSLPDWDNIEKMQKLQKVDSLLSRAIIIAMNRRSILLFEEPIFSSVIYLDPRFQRMLTIEQKSIAKNHLNKTWNAMKYISEKIVNNDVVEATNDGTNCEINELDELEVFLSSQGSAPCPEVGNNDNRSIRVIIEEYDNVY